MRRTPRSTLFPYTTLFRSERRARWGGDDVPEGYVRLSAGCERTDEIVEDVTRALAEADIARSEEHTSELQSQSNLVCRLLLEKKKISSDISHFLCRIVWLC